MKIRIPGYRRRAVKVALIAIPVVSLAITGLTLPWPLAMLITLTLGITAGILDRAIFVYKGILLMPGPSPDMHRFSIGTSWIVEDLETLDRLGMAIVYKYKNAAKHAFRMLRSWNYGRYNDPQGNIIMSVVREGGSRYTIFFYPGERSPSVEAAHMALASDKGPRAEVDLTLAKCYIAYCVDYSDEPVKKRIIEAVPGAESIRLIPVYLEDDHVKPYAKKEFLLKQVIFLDRESVTPNMMESVFHWSDPLDGLPQHVIESVKRANETLERSRNKN